MPGVSSCGGLFFGFFFFCCCCSGLLSCCVFRWHVIYGDCLSGTLSLLPMRLLDACSYRFYSFFFPFDAVVPCHFLNILDCLFSEYIGHLICTTCLGIYSCLFNYLLLRTLDQLGRFPSITSNTHRKKKKNKTWSILDAMFSTWWINISGIESELYRSGAVVWSRQASKEIACLILPRQPPFNSFLITFSSAFDLLYVLLILVIDLRKQLVIL